MRRPPKISVWAVLGGILNEESVRPVTRFCDAITSWRLDACYPHYSNAPATTAHFAHRRVNREERMADPIYKVVEVVGTSEQSISKAIDNAINKASGTLRNLGWFEVEQMRGAIKDGKVQRYQVTLKVGFTLE
jgi:dodecin